MNTDVSPMVGCSKPCVNVQAHKVFCPPWRKGSPEQPQQKVRGTWVEKTGLMYGGHMVCQWRVQKEKRHLGMCLFIEALLETTMLKIQETMRNTLLCREKWKRTADKATQRKPENLQQQLWTYGVWICGCPWDQLGCLQGQIHFHHNNMKTLICVFCCTDTLITRAKAIVGKISQEHRSDQAARTAILVVISTPFIYWKLIQNTKLPRRSLVKQWKN